MRVANKLIFCFPYRGVGGVSILFARMADHLALRGFRVAIVDYPDGYLSQSVRCASVEKIPYYDDQPVPLEPDALVVMQSTVPWSIRPSLRFSDMTRILFWNCHPHNLVPMLPGLRSLMSEGRLWSGLFKSTILRGYYRKTACLLDVLETKKSIVYMDGANARTTNSALNRSYVPRYLPIVVDAPPYGAKDLPSRWHKNGLRLAWVGRIADFKYPILRYTLNELNKIQESLGVPVRFTVIGSGPYEAALRADCALWKKIEIEFVPHLPNEQVLEYLRDNVDFLFAMGTAALEGAAVGVPTILLDVAYVAVPPGYIFTWIQDRADFTLGEMINHRPFEPGNTTLRDRLSEAIADYRSSSQESLEYYRASFMPESVVSKFLAFAAEAGATYGDLKRAGLTARDLPNILYQSLKRYGLTKHLMW